jgi:hypothetical protein
MHKITFSHDYEKLPRDSHNTTAILLSYTESYIWHLMKLCPNFLTYDTMLRGQIGRYNFNFNHCLILTFIHRATGIPFSTIRPFNKAKKLWYSKQVGQEFIVCITPLLDRPVKS